MLLLVANTSVSASSMRQNTASEIGAIGVQLTIDYANSTQEEFTNLTGVTAFDVLNQTATVTFTQFAYGKFIEAINGVVNNADNNGHYWQYWVNDELAPVAADNYALSDNDHVFWKYCAPEEPPIQPPATTPDFLIGIGITGGLVVLILFAALFITRRIR